MKGRGILTFVTDDDPRQSFAALLQGTERGVPLFLEAYRCMDGELLVYLRDAGISIEAELPPTPEGIDVGAAVQWLDRLACLQAAGLRRLDSDPERERFKEFGRECAIRVQDHIFSKWEALDRRLIELASLCEVRQGDEMRLVTVFRSDEYAEAHYAHGLAELVAKDFLREGIAAEVRERLDPHVFEVWAQCSELDIALVMRRRMPLCEFLVECAKRNIRPSDLGISSLHAEVYEKPIELGVEVPFKPAVGHHG